MSQPLPEDIETLLQELRSQDASHRLKAVNSLANLKVIDRQILDALKSVAANDPNLIVRECAQDALPALRKGYIPSSQEKRDFWIGFLGCLVINTVMWVVMVSSYGWLDSLFYQLFRGRDVHLIFVYFVFYCLPFLVNIVALIYLGYTRPRMVRGVLVALAFIFIIRLCAGVLFGPWGFGTQPV